MRLVGEGQGLLAVATNSEQVKVFDRRTKNCQILSGHGGIVLSVDASHDGNTIVTSSKVCGAIPSQYLVPCQLCLVTDRITPFEFGSWT